MSFGQQLWDFAISIVRSPFGGVLYWVVFFGWITFVLVSPSCLLSIRLNIPLACYIMSVWFLV